MLLLAGGLLAACGSGGDGQASPSAAATAADLLPDLSDLGFQRDGVLKPPSLDPQVDAAVAIYTGRDSAVGSVRVEVSLHPTADAASAQFGPVAEALRNPPPDLFGPGTVQSDGQAVYHADAARSYVTARPDRDGNLVYTDAYRLGRAVIIVYTLGRDAEATRTVREAIASRLDERAPR